MNEVGCQRAIQKLLQDYSGVLTYGHYHGGTYREIKEITLSALTPPREYYHIKIQVQGTTEASEISPGNQAKPDRRAVYSCMIQVVDPALPSNVAGEEQYELAHIYFRTMCDGIAAMIPGAEWKSGGVWSSYFADLPICIEDPESDSKFSLARARQGDRSVKVQNMDHTWADPNNDTWTPIHYSEISFTLVEQ